MTHEFNVDLDAGKVQVELFNQTEAALATLRERYSEVPDFHTPEGYEEGKQAIKTLTGYRTALEAKRKEIKQPYLDAGRIIDAEAKRITAGLVELEEPMKAAKKEVDDIEKRRKEQRLARLRAKIQEIEAYVSRARNQDSAAIAEMIETVDAIDTQQDFYELTDEAVRAQAEVLDKLGEMYSDRLQYEQAEQARKEAEAKARAQEEAQRIEQAIQAIRMVPLDMMGKPAVLIRTKIAELEYNWPATAQYGDRAHEAEQAHEQALSQLVMMQQQAEQLEAAQAQQNAVPDGELDKAPMPEGMQNRGMTPPPGAANAGMGGGGPILDEAMMQQRAEQEQIDQAAMIDEPEGEGIPAEDMACVTERIQQHSENAGLMEAIATWCDKWGVSLEASQELGEIIEKHFK